MFEISCPSCGNPVRFRRESSLYSTCDACGSIMLRKDANIELLGKAADLQPDNTPLQVGTRGQYKGQGFEILGRIQIRQEEGFWNEWYLGYDNGSAGWLGEALGEYFVSFEVKEPKLPAFKDIHLSKKLKLKGTDFYVTNIGQSIVSSYEGELPFIMQNSYELPYADLRSNGSRAATLDYSDGEPLLFIGTYEEFEDLHFTGLRDPDDHVKRRTAATVTTMKCPACGGPHSMSSAGPQSQTMVCEYCGSAIDISNSEQYKILWQATEKEKNQPKPRIQLNSKGKFKGVEWEVIGCQYKFSRADGMTYPWEEYLCYERCHGYRYLVYSKGHWSWSQTLHELPTNLNILQSNKKVKGQTFKHYEGYEGRVRAVFGEFPYKVDIKAKSDIQDYVCPSQGLGLSRECDLIAKNREVYWSIAEYVTDDEVRRSFQVTSDKETPYEIGSFEPNRYWGTMLHTIMLGLLTVGLAFMFCVFMQMQNKTVYHESFAIETNREPSRLTKEFNIEGHTQAVEVNFNTDLQNRWLYLDLALVNTQTNEATLFNKSLSYYSGSDGGEYWSEGSKNGYVIVPRIKPGTYVLRLDPQAGTGNNPDTLEPSKDKKSNAKHERLATVNLAVNVSPPYWTWCFLLTFLGILPFPCLYGLLWFSKESERWNNSDHPWSSDDDDDD